MRGYNPEPPCECPGPGLCPRYRREQTEYTHGLCAGTNCSPQRSDAQRRAWRRALEGPPPTQYPVPSTRSPNRPVIPSSRHPVKSGPGTELKKLLASLGLHASGGCGCGDRAAAMDAWGVEGCRSHREEILAWLREEQAKAGWAAKLKAAALAVATGLAFRLDPLDPAPGLLDEALRRAEN